MRRHWGPAHLGQLAGGRFTARRMLARRMLALAACAALLSTFGGQQASAAPGARPAAATAGQGATPALPPGWSLTEATDGTGGLLLTWTPLTRLRLGDAQAEIHADGATVGVATVSPDGLQVSVEVLGVPRDPASVQVWAAGRRLDPAAPVAAQAARPDPAEAVEPALRPLSKDPGAPGPYAVTSGEYTRPGLVIAGLPAPVEVQAVVVSPVAAPGVRPLVLVLHGRHGTCFRGGPAGQDSGDWPCPAGWQPIPSYLGYLQAQRLLASQGYDTVSISANGINGQDFRRQDGGARARSDLVRAHLTWWASWSGAGRTGAPAIIRATSPADLSQVMLVGHSRGGEGTNRAALDSQSGRAVPWHIAGQLLLAPTAFGANPAPGVPTVVVLPYCDGDVFDLQGQLYVDAARDLTRDPVLRSAVLVRGANHNFFNSEWTPGSAKAPAFDDWFDPKNSACGTQAPGNPRLSPAEQRQVGATYAAAAAAVIIRRDADVVPLLDGTGVRAGSAGRAKIVAHAIGARRDPVAVPGAGLLLTGSGGTSVRTCEPVDPVSAGGSCLSQGGSFSVVAPHLLGPFGLPGEPQRRFAEVRWTRAGGRADLGLARPVSLAGDTALAMRIFAPPGAAPAGFTVQVRDVAGHSVALGAASVTGLPPAQGNGKYWAREVRVPVDAAALTGAGVDASRIASLSLVPTTATGQIWLVDAWGWRSGLSGAPPPVLPRVDVGRLEVTEGDSGTRTVNVPVRFSGPTDRAGRVVLYVLDQRGFDPPTATVLQVVAGTRLVDVPVTVTGNVLDDFSRVTVQVQVQPLDGIATGDYLGGVSILDDDPSPRLTVTPVADQVTEGGSLTWRFTLSGPSNVDVFTQFRTVAPATGHELSTDDVTAAWLLEQGIPEPPSPPVTLSAAGIFPFVDLRPGQTSVDLTVPTVADHRTEGAEKLVLRALGGFGFGPGLPAGSRLVGTVSD